MSTTRRAPLSNNPNVANSPMRVSAAALQGSKKIRSHADLLREESYGQPPPAKRQMIARETGSPTRTKPARTIVHRGTSTRTPGISSSHTAPSHRAALAAHAAAQTQAQAQAQAQAQDTRAAYRPSASESTSLEEWQANIRARFPKMVFYFESVPEEARSRLARQVAHLGARDEKFFDRQITHVVTTRHIPAPVSRHEGNDATDGHDEHPKTIDPSLLNRSLDTTKKKSFDTNPSSRRVQMPPVQEERLRRPVTRSADILQRAQEMKMKIWTVDKLYRILEVLEQNPYKSYKPPGTAPVRKPTDQADLLRLLQAERINGPSDRDPTVATKELHYFKGFYLYVYDIEEKTKPIMVREYAKVVDKKDGEWPQFRVASQGRCPFVEDYDPQEKENRRAKERVVKAIAAPPAPTTQRPERPPRPVTGKRSLAVMEDGQNRTAAPARDVEPFDRSRVPQVPQLDFRTQNAFMSHAKAGRLLAGEPVASGLQPSNVTSAIRSQMISSTSGVLGAKAGTSKEIHGLQRKVLQKASTPAVSQDISSRQVGELSHDSNTFVRSASASRATSRKLDVVDEEETVRQKEKLRRTVSMPVPRTKQKREPKPGYCENCQDKFEDFEEHIVSRKHRKFAENNNNWAELDALLSKLKRHPRYRHEVDDAEY
ncbi:Dfp1/Him1, central region-domain-containing protein [Podospora australis]|uniref:Dfp1/Him1, central region-domain-containing protein n=1 Tax=Podospora australis TaxID=1536484 RepID=A0AAN6WS80_9PEZI|nr:Dfp1/Him1, central region-domain-containing protein [Podospora australis]